MNRADGGHLGDCEGHLGWRGGHPPVDRYRRSEPHPIGSRHGNGVGRGSVYWGDRGDCQRDCGDSLRCGGDRRRFGGDSRHYGLVSQALVEAGDDGALVHLLTDEDQLLHAVAILLVPVAAQPGLTVHQFAQLVFGHGGIPLSSIL